MKDCNQCGKCCIRYGDGGLVANAEEIDWWHEHRPDIARYEKDGKIWMDPETGKQLSHCPWMEKAPGQIRYTCRIYEHRPEDCRHYPVTIHQMAIDECEMLEPGDLDFPERAQEELDRLMAASRPPEGSIRKQGSRY